MSELLLWLIYDDVDIEKNRYYIKLYEEKCRKRGIDMRLICRSILYKPEIDSAEMPLPDIAINRSRDARIGAYLEQHGAAVFNNSFVTRICNDKGKTWEYLHDKGIPMMDTVICGKEPSAEVTHRFPISELPYSYPLVVKSCGGHGGSEVFLAHNRQEFDAACAKMKEERIVVQRAADTLGRDLRVYVIGNEIVAGILRESTGDFRSNYSLGGRASLHRLTEEETALVKSVMRHFDFGLVGIDLIYDHGRPVLNEIEDAVGARMLYHCTDIDLVGKYLDFILVLFSY